MSEETVKIEDLKLSKKSIFYAKVGDIVGNRHRQFGRILELDDRRCRAHLGYLDESGGYYETSITGDNALETLDINGYKIYETHKANN